MDESRSVEFGSAMQSLMAGISRRNPDLSASARLRTAWERCAQAGAFEHTDYVYIVPNTGAREVVIYVDSPIWATELNMQSELLRLKINVEIDRMAGAFRARTGSDQRGEGQVRKLVFRPSKEKYKHGRQAAATTPDARNAEEAEIEPIPLTPTELAQLHEDVAGIENESLRKAAFEAAKASLELLKGKESRA